MHVSEWRFVAERGLECYNHSHDRQRGDSRTLAHCELSFLKKVSQEQANLRATGGWKEHIIGEVPHATITKAANVRQSNDNTTSAANTSATRLAGQFKCVGAIRKAGFLSVKKWILKRRQSIELARKQGWKRYWVCLRGTALLFHSVIEEGEDEAVDENDNIRSGHPEASSATRHQPAATGSARRIDLLSWLNANCASQVPAVVELLRSENFELRKPHAKAPQVHEQFLQTMSKCYIEREPRHLIIVESAIAQPIPEHPRRDFVFCLSTSFGDAYLFQAACQLESDNWIAAIHNACAASIARNLTRDEAIKLFQTKARNLELDAEKKIFLRQRLESRLTSMSSIASGISAEAGSQQQSAPTKQNSDKLTMRSLLYRLSQQLLALDAYIEQMHCEIYQLRCYLSSCGAQQLFYVQDNSTTTSTSKSTANQIDLPHPKSLLMHVSKATKLLLIKLGVFTVSSFHAYTHARQESADCILQNIQQVNLNQLQQLQNKSTDSKTSVELRVRSHSLSDSILRGRQSDEMKSALESDAEKLIEMSDLRSIRVRVDRKIYNSIRQYRGNENDDPTKRPATEETTSDDRFSITNENDSTVLVSMKLHSNSDQAAIIKQLLHAIEPDSGEFEFLNYYLRFKVNESCEGLAKKPSDCQYVAKRRETLRDWETFGDELELAEKIVFKLDLIRRKMDEESAPFGVSVEAQLIASSQLESVLNVFCSYVEWGSVADKAGLRDDDELLMINGVPVKDLDMMFVECLIQEGSRLRLIVRSSRSDCPSGAILLDNVTWRPASEDDDDDGHGGGEKKLHETGARLHVKDGTADVAGGSQLISDEYISSLVCPPPPSQSGAFLRADTSLLRQKSDLCGDSKINKTPEKEQKNILKAISQHNLDLADVSEAERQLISSALDDSDLTVEADNQGVFLAHQLVKKSEQLTSKFCTKSSEKRSTDSGQQQSYDANSVERLRKSVLELLETEYAFIKHLETINEHYLNPLAEISFLGIAQLKQLSHVLLDLLAFQRTFFTQLLQSVLTACQSSAQTENQLSESLDELEKLNLVVSKLETSKSPSEFKPTLDAIAGTFDNEANKFKQYVSYCVTYSKLQKLLHPRKGPRNSGNQVTNSSGPSSIAFMPPTLNTFHTSSSQSFVSVYSNTQVAPSQHREFLKPLGSLMQTKPSTYDHEAQKQLLSLAEFLGNLDSSSSSISLSLPRSSSSEQSAQNVATITKQSSGSSQQLVHQKSAHQQNFESYLIKPIQRIVKYPMLLNSIATAANQLLQSDDNSTADLQNAVKKMESVVSHVNEAQCLHEEYGALFDNIERQYSEQQADQLSGKTSAPSPLVGAHQPPIDLSIEQLLYFNSVEWLNISEFAPKLKKLNNLSQVLFVFNSCVIFICKEQVVRPGRGKKGMPIPSGNSFNRITNLAAAKQSTSQDHVQDLNNNNTIIRYQCLIPVSEVQVRSVPVHRPTQEPQTTEGQETFKWEMFQCSSSNSNSSLLTKSNKRASKQSSGKVFVLASRNNEERNMFLRRIRLIIRESVRNMSLRLTRSPSSKSLTTTNTKKLSSPSSGTNTNNSSCSHSTSLSPAYNSNDTNEQFVVECKYTPSNRVVGVETATDATFKTGIQVNN